MTDLPILWQNLTSIQEQALAELESVQDEAGLQAWRTAHLGRSSAVMRVFSDLGKLSKGNARRWARALTR